MQGRFSYPFTNYDLRLTRGRALSSDKRYTQQLHSIMETGLNEKVVVVTGASGGIGSAIARRFAEEGAKVVVHYRRQRAQAEALKLPREQSLLVGADLTKEAHVRRLFASAVKRFGRVDTLIANAGSWETRDVPLQEMSLRQWQATLDAVLTSTFLC